MNIFIIRGLSFFFQKTRFLVSLLSFIINNPCSYSASSYSASSYCVLNRDMIVKKLDSRVKRYNLNFLASLKS
jgi:hypothetical protein